MCKLFCKCIENGLKHKRIKIDTNSNLTKVKNGQEIIKKFTIYTLLY